MQNSVLTHWGRVTHICVGKLIVIGSDNGMSPDRRQAIIWPTAGLLSIGPLANIFQWKFNKNTTIFIEENARENVVCEMAFILSRPQCVKCIRNTVYKKYKLCYQTMRSIVSICENEAPRKLIWGFRCRLPWEVCFNIWIGLSCSTNNHYESSTFTYHQMLIWNMPWHIPIPSLTGGPT